MYREIDRSFHSAVIFAGRNTWLIPPVSAERVEIPLSHRERTRFTAKTLMVDITYYAEIVLFNRPTESKLQSKSTTMDNLQMQVLTTSPAIQFLPLSLTINAGVCSREGILSTMTVALPSLPKTPTLR